MTSNIIKKRKYTDYDLNGESLNILCDDFDEKLTITKIYKKKKIFNDKTSIKIKDLKTHKCSVHNDENMCVIYDCPGISIGRYQDNYKSHLEKFDFYS
jgi:hypothetical protein